MSKKCDALFSKDIINSKVTWEMQENCLDFLRVLINSKKYYN